MLMERDHAKASIGVFAQMLQKIEYLYSCVRFCQSIVLLTTKLYF